jgi:electron transfer flavoprotein beta subunit
VDIIILLKQVPSTETILQIADDGRSIKTDDINWVINPYDEFAVEEALRIREKQGGTVTLVSVGTAKAVEAIRTAMAMGADKGILVNDPLTASCDGLGIARILAAVVQTLPYDLIIAGQRAVDDDNFLVGAAVAEFLKIPFLSLVIKQEITDGKIQCHRTIEGGAVVVQSTLPALFTTQRGLNEPRYASLPGVMKAKKKPLETKTLEDLGVTDAAVLKPMLRISSIRFPEKRKAGKIIDAPSPQAKAAELVRILHEEAKVI